MARLNTKLQVSIHAPVWVRPVPCTPENIVSGFQFTHPCGCDMISLYQILECCRFNSRTRVGATNAQAPESWDYDVSIHAPVWVRRRSYSALTGSILFQFTHPCGCDLPLGIHSPCRKGFNSRTRVGATKIKNQKTNNRKFQFTHPCGCDGLREKYEGKNTGFNSRTRVGATSGGSGV